MKIPKLFQILFCLLFSFVAFSQERNDTAATATKRKKIAIGFTYEAKYCYRTTNNKKSGISTYVGSELGIGYSYNSNQEIPKYGYTTGLRFSYFPAKHIGINIGATYSTMGYKTKLIDTLISGIFGGPYYTGFPPVTTYNETKFNISYIYFSFPLSIDYIKKIKKFEFITGGGISINLIRSANVQNENFKRPIEREYNNNQFYPKTKEDHRIYYNFHIGCYYYLNDRFVMGLTPSFNYQKNKVSVHLYSIGTELKLLFKL